MTATGRAAAELHKLAHALDVTHDRLEMVAALPAEELRLLRAQVGEALFQADRHYFARVAALSKSVPTAIVAKLTETVLPPLIAARTAELLEPKKAVELVARLSDRYLADVSAVMDPSRAPEIVAAIPPERVGAITAELVQREDWVVIAGFVGQVTDDSLRASVAEFAGEHLLRIAFVLDEVSRLDEITGLITDEQIDQLLTAAAELSLWQELEQLLGHLAPERVGRLAARFRRFGEDLRARFAAAVEQGLLDAAAHDRVAAA